MVALLCLLITGCNNQAGTQQDLPVPGAGTPTPATTPTEPPWVPEPTHPMMDEVWQPPEPHKRVQFAQPTEIAESPDAMLVYEVAGLVGNVGFKVTVDGMAVLGGYQGDYTTYQLSTDEFNQIKQLVAAADFPNLAGRYWEEDPPGVIAEIPIVTITYIEGGRAKAVALRGSDHTPQALRDLQSTLENLVDKVREEGTRPTRPARLVGYYLQGTAYTWWLDIDEEGGLYYDSGPVNDHMSPADLAALRETLDDISSLGSNEWFTAPDDVRDIIFMDEHRAIITTYANGEQKQWINALSGATVPQGLQTLLEKLAEVYDKYAPGT
ncbi:MAG: hypothetical protein M3441_02640 [Chloroflexota bacterium]|nr:hypothetical protein [Chloroflexota bacterium]